MALPLGRVKPTLKDQRVTLQTKVKLLLVWSTQSFYMGRTWDSSRIQIPLCHYQWARIKSWDSYHSCTDLSSTAKTKTHLERQKHLSTN